MQVTGTSWVERVTLVAAIACLYAGAIQVNNHLLFPWAEVDTFRYGVFLPAGLKLVLVMLFGGWGVAGLALGIATVTLAELQQISYASALALGLILGLTPYLVVVLLARVLRLAYPWNGLTFRAIALISLCVGLLDALALHLGLSMLQLERVDDLWQDLGPAAFGRVSGTFIFLGVAVWVNRQIARARTPPAA